MKAYENPIKELQRVFEPISPKIGTILASFQTKVKEKLTATGATLKRAGTWLSVPKLHDINPVNSGIDSCQNWFESIMVGFLVNPENAQIADMFRQSYEWGYLINLCRDEVCKSIFLMLSNSTILSKQQWIQLFGINRNYQN